MKVEVPNHLWSDNTPRRLAFPERWKVSVLEPPGFAKPAIAAAGIADAFDSPVGCPEIGWLAGRAREAVVIFDDMTRPTPVSAVLPELLGRLREAGLGRDSIRFIAASGMHAPMNRIEFSKKLGEEVVREYHVFNHNPYENCDDVGRTPGGMPVTINSEFMSCDLKIGIGCITPHVQAAFGGGGKIVLPGVCGHETIKSFHTEVMTRDWSRIGFGTFGNNALRDEIDLVTRMSGLQVKIDALVNARGEITDLVVGDPIEGFEAGVRLAERHYGTVKTEGHDIVVSNAFGKASEMSIAAALALQAASPEKAAIVIVVDSPEGQVCHFLLNRFGMDIGGAGFVKRGGMWPNVTGILLTEHPDRTMLDWIVGHDDHVRVCTDWGAVLALLEEMYPAGAKVAVIPDGTMQYYLS